MNRRQTLRGAGAVCAALALPGVLGACGERAREAPGLRPGEPFPLPPLPSLAEDGVLRPETLRGRALVVNFWATWCEPCRKEMPSLELLHRDTAQARLAVIGICVDDDLNLAREFLRQMGVTFPNYSDRGQKLAGERLRVRGFPVTYVVAADGAARAQITGARDWASADTLRLLEQTLQMPLTAR